MSSDKVYRTVHQYNKEPISEEDMRKLQEIADDYARVKNYVYARFGGIASLPKLYPGYTIQNEMTGSGFRQTLSLPSVYFYLAVFDALGDIKSQWTRTKVKIQELINRNESFTEEEKHYLRFILKVKNAFGAVLNQEEIELPKEIQKTYDRLASQTDVEKLHRYLRRQVRKYYVRQHTDAAKGFSLSERAYRYGDHGIYISMKEKRKRIFIPLTDHNQYKCQIYLKLCPENHGIVLHVPVSVTMKKHPDYTNQIGISAGIYTMLTTDQGHCYGEELGRYQTEYADWIRGQTASYNRNRSSNPGRKKYSVKKRRLTERMYSYINHELNRFLEAEKPQTIYMVKLPAPGGGGVNRRINHSVSLWQRGYIRSRLVQKCREQSVEVVEVLGKDISHICSSCSAAGTKKEGAFLCSACGCHMAEKINTAKNVLKRGIEGQVVR